MPFKSDAQRRYLYAQHPEIAQRWTAEYGTPKNLPEHAGKVRLKRARMRRIKKS